MTKLIGPTRRPQDMREETYLDDADGLLLGLSLDDDEVVGLDDLPARLDDPATSLPDDDDRDGDALPRWQDVGMAEDAVDLDAALTPDADENGYTRAGDAVGIAGEFETEDLLAGFSPRYAGDDDPAIAADGLLADLALPELPSLHEDNDEGAELGPEEDVDALAATMLRRSSDRTGARGSDDG